jgi:amidase
MKTAIPFGPREPVGDFKPAFATAVASAAAIRRKSISATELLNLTLRRVDLHNPTINAIVWQDRERARARARQADEMLAQGRTWGPLHGVPVTIKEAFAYQGSPNTWGLPPLKNATSARTAVAVERLESAGAIVIGKTNVPVMLGDWQSYNPIFGTTNNPWDVTRTPGGSTGGGAAALAAGFGCLTLGSDLSGSIRIPAHFCGVYGHKPTLELVSTAGFQPGPWDGSPGVPMDLAVVGPLARSAHDLALTLNAIGGANGDDRKAWTWRLPAPRHSRLKDFRIGYVMVDELAPVGADVATLYERALAEMSRAGAKMERGWPQGVDPQAQLKTYLYLLFAFVNSEVSHEQRQQARARFEKHPSDIAAAATVEPHRRWLQETLHRLRCRAIWQTYFENHDVFLCPGGFSAAFPHDHSQPIEARVVETAEGKQPYLNTPLWTIFATLSGLPATVVPVGRTHAGLPAGMQIMAPMWEDGTSIEFAALLAETFGGFTEPPALRE